MIGAGRGGLHQRAGQLGFAGMWGVIVFSAVATFVGAFVLDTLVDGVAFWIALGVAVGASLGWVTPRHSA